MSMNLFTAWYVYHMLSQVISGLLDIIDLSQLTDEICSVSKGMSLCMCVCVHVYVCVFVCTCMCMCACMCDINLLHLQHTVVDHVYMVSKVTLHCEAAITVVTWRTLSAMLCSSKPHLPPDWSIQLIMRDLCEAVRTKLDACLGMAIQLQAAATTTNQQVCIDTCLG